MLSITRNTLRLLVPKRCPICRNESVILVLETKCLTMVALMEDGRGDLMDESEPYGTEMKLDYYRCNSCCNEFHFDDEYVITSEELFREGGD